MNYKIIIMYIGDSTKKIICINIVELTYSYEIFVVYSILKDSLLNSASVILQILSLRLGNNFLNKNIINSSL